MRSPVDRSATAKVHEDAPQENIEEDEQKVTEEEIQEEIADFFFLNFYRLCVNKNADKHPGVLKVTTLSVEKNKQDSVDEAFGNKQKLFGGPLQKSNEKENQKMDHTKRPSDDKELDGQTEDKQLKEHSRGQSDAIVKDQLKNTRDGQSDGLHFRLHMDNGGNKLIKDQQSMDVIMQSSNFGPLELNNEEFADLAINGQGTEEHARQNVELGPKMLENDGPTRLSGARMESGILIPNLHSNKQSANHGPSQKTNIQGKVSSKINVGPNVVSNPTNRERSSKVAVTKPSHDCLENKVAYTVPSQSDKLELETERSVNNQICSKQNDELEQQIASSSMYVPPAYSSNELIPTADLGGS